MKRSWINFLAKIEDEILRLEELGSDIICFRGQADNGWDLLPSLLIQKKINRYSDKIIYDIECRIYFDFVTNAGTLLNRDQSDWEILFEMRHHGIPTRLLDWSENFGTALYFAMNGNGKSPSIWILDPYELNKISYGKAVIPNPIHDLKYSYNEAYLEKSKDPFKDPIVLIGPRNSKRLFAQKGLFTLQGTSFTPMNHIPEIKHCFKKFEIPLDSFQDAERFLKLAGINDYSLFPDLDGLSKYLNKIHGLC